MKNNDTQPAEMELAHEPYMIELPEAAWLAKALSLDEHRRVLMSACIQYFKGYAVLVTTDTHRLHALRLGPVPNKFAPKVIDLRRIIFEARFIKATHIALSHDFASVQIGFMKKDVFEPHPIYAPVFPENPGTYPDVTRVIPDTETPATEIYGINGKYFVDAVGLANKDAMRVYVLQEAKLRPILFKPNDVRWFAVVMPMNLMSGSA